MEPEGWWGDVFSIEWWCLGSKEEARGEWGGLGWVVGWVFTGRFDVNAVMEEAEEEEEEEAENGVLCKDERGKV